MLVVEILDEIKKTSGSKAKKQILEDNSENHILKKILVYGLDKFKPFNIVKVPKTLERNPDLDEEKVWNRFFTVADRCASREVSGNNAVELMSQVFERVSAEEEAWMRKVLQKRLAIGASTQTVNKVFPGLIKTFEVSLAQKFSMRRIEGRKEVGIEPKLDGIRCFVIVDGENVQMFARSGKLITNFENTLAPELKKLGDGCYDGELMGQDFISLMRQAYRKENVDVTNTFLALFDYVPLTEWNTKETVLSCEERYEELLDKLSENDVNLSLLQPVERINVESSWDEIKQQHDDFVAEGYEGAMIKLLDAPYKFGRGWEVMKLKAFHDVDLQIVDLIEGTGKHAGKLGSVKVIYEGVSVQVGSGFTDEMREIIWRDPSSFIGRTVEIRYQEITPDGSLRFPTFVCFRNDR